MQARGEQCRGTGARGVAEQQEDAAGWDAAPDGHGGTGRAPGGRDGHSRADNPAMFMSGKLQEMFHIALIALCLQRHTHTLTLTLSLLEFPARFPCSAVFPSGAALCSAILSSQLACTGHNKLSLLWGDAAVG